VDLANELKRPAGWEFTRLWEDLLVSHGKDSRLRGLPTRAAKEMALCGG